MRSTYKIAGKVIEITSIYAEVHILCKAYACEEIPDFKVKIMQSHIDFEREKSALEDKKAGIPTRNFPDSYLETLAVYRKIAEQMIEYDTILFHGSVVAVDGVGYLFTAKSGTGKSTHTRLWTEYFGKRAVMVNDDKPLLRLSENDIIAYGTPWNGKHRLGTNTNVPLKALCILERAEENHICRITKAAAYNLLIQQVYKPGSPQKLIQTLQLADRLAEHVKLYKMGCNMDISAAEIAYNGMKG